MITRLMRRDGRFITRPLALQSQFQAAVQLVVLSREAVACVFCFLAECPELYDSVGRLVVLEKEYEDALG